MQQIFVIFYFYNDTVTTQSNKNKNFESTRDLKINIYRVKQKSRNLS